MPIDNINTICYKIYKECNIFSLYTVDNTGKSKKNKIYIYIK